MGAVTHAVLGDDKLCPVQNNKGVWIFALLCEGKQISPQQQIFSTG